VSARTHIAHIVNEFGDMPLSSLRASQVKAWVAKMQDHGYSPSYVQHLHKRLSQILADAIHDNVLATNPCSRRTPPPTPPRKCYVATTEQVWALYDAVPEHLRAAVLLGAFAGLRVAEVAGLRISDVDFLRGVVHPKQQWRGAPLKTPGCDAPIPIPRELTLLLSASVAKYGTDMMVTNGHGGPCSPSIIKQAMVATRSQIEGLPEGFSFHDLRHYFASLLIASGADIKTVQARLRHATATTTLDTYSHLWPDADESTRTAVAAVITARTATGA
jgi:integrase